MLRQSFIDKLDTDVKLEDRLLFDVFERAHKLGKITEFVNLQTGEHADNGYILKQASISIQNSIVLVQNYSLLK